MPTGKGMGLTQHYQTLRALRDNYTGDDSGLTVVEVVEEMNKRFAWWDDPQTGGPAETCRSYLKEMWRFGMIDRIASNGSVLPRTLDSWNIVGSARYRINARGCNILSYQEKCFPYFTAWCIVETVDMGMYPQCAKLLELAKKTGSIPVSDKDASELTKSHKIYVERHAIKAIKFGWLESTGLIYRHDRGRYKVNTNFWEWLRCTPFDDVFAKIRADVNTTELTVTISPPYMGYVDFDRHSELKFVVTLTNKSDRKISVDLMCEPSAMIEHISKFYIEKHCELKPHESKNVDVKVTSRAHGVSDSFGKFHMGVLKVRDANGENRAYLPTVGFAKVDRVWETQVIEKLRSLGLYTLHLGQADRPDGVVDLSGIRDRPEHALEYLRDPNKKKMLVETAVGTYKWSKRVEDTQPSGGEGKFERHTSKVLKIQAVGQVIIASRFSDIDIVEARRNHTVTLITMEMLDHIISKRKEVGNGHKAVCSILQSNKMVDVLDINQAFEEL